MTDPSFDRRRVWSLRLQVAPDDRPPWICLPYGDLPEHFAEATSPTGYVPATQKQDERVFVNRFIVTPPARARCLTIRDEKDTSKWRAWLLVEGVREIREVDDGVVMAVFR